MLAFIDFTLIDLIDILLVGLIIFQLYKLTKGTVAIRIFFGILAIYLLWKLVTALQMQMLGEILGQFIGVGVIALIIVFQQELRQFLLFIGSREIVGSKPGFMQRWFNQGEEGEFAYEAVLNACERMGKSKTGALIVIARTSDPSAFIRSSRSVDAKLSSYLLESIFFKNSPLHDGAVLIRNRRIVSASGVLPVTQNEKAPQNIGMRHRAALGISEQSDAIAIVVSEETGSLAYAENGLLHQHVSVEKIKEALTTHE
ncbi:diadenylate cyclase CdaA [Sanyastnella coralliicola]|uniref:diadenylate cyclase CdaA n=1 Tax=Sanyastnella coralliicola TaxID=3069118 RepID=UPI0027B99802|nr:diadenylate cyclase CdaA [Longitalea sp. SCSIO 12813]